MINNKGTQEYFCRDKSDWYIINNGGQKEWDLSKVDEFWELIRINKMAQKDYNFDNFVFPKFQMNGHDPVKRKSNFNWDFWSKGQIKEFDGVASFVNSKFLAPALFSGTNFNNIKFILTVFEEGAHFHNLECNGRVEFGHLNIQKYISFYGSKFNGSRDTLSFSSVIFDAVTDFRDIQVHSKLRLINSSFNYRVLFNKAIFNEVVEFKHNDIFKSIDLSRVNFSKKVLFENNNFSSFKLDSINKESIELNGINHVPSPPKLEFIDSYFNQNCILSNIDLSNVSFINCDVSDLSFKRCDWIVKNNRLYSNENGKELKNFEEHYRQLKRNFDNRKHWEMSGFAYVSEMETRQKRLWEEKNYYSWFIYWFYGFFSRYTQDIKRPVVSLLVLILFSSIYYYFIDYSYLKAIQRGFKGALPYLLIDTENPFQGYWLILRNIEFLLSGTFFAFFVLALRKKFKQ